VNIAEAVAKELLPYKELHTIAILKFENEVGINKSTETRTDGITV